MENYFENALNQAHENYLGAAGDQFHAGGYDNRPSLADVSFPAAGDNGVGFVPTSQPYIISVQNTNTTTAVSSVSILDAYTQLGESSPAFGNGVNIAITSGLSNVTYTQLLRQLADKPIMVGMTYIQSSNATQVLETVTVQHNDANGNTASSTITPTLDPNQQQSGVITNYLNYRVDGYTKLTLNQVLANTTVKIYLYPKTKVDLAMGTVGANIDRSYSSPDVIRPLRIQGA